MREMQNAKNLSEDDQEFVGHIKAALIARDNLIKILVMTFLFYLFYRNGSTKDA